LLPPRNVARIRRIPRGLSAVAAVAAILVSTPAAVAGPAPDFTSSKEVVESPDDSISCSVGAEVWMMSDPDEKPPMVPMVFGQASVVCTASVTEIRMWFNFYKDGQLIVSRLLTGEESIVTTEYRRCAPGTYTVTTEALITFPPGFDPRWAKASKTSEEWITC
jgi:hypothetical protein